MAQTVINSHLIFAITFILILLVSYTMIKLLNPIKKDSKTIQVVHSDEEYYIKGDVFHTNNMEDNIVQLLSFSHQLQRENKQLADRIEHLENLKEMRKLQKCQ